jgi:hypothetical protein
MASRIPAVLAAACALAAVAGLHEARASESGTSVYLLGSGGPAAAVSPPLKGVFFSNTLYGFSGSVSGSKPFVVGGKLAAGLDANVVADFPALLWVPSTHFAGGTLMLGAVVPFGEPRAKATVTVTGPLGTQITREVSDSAFVVGDPLLTGSIGWASGNWHAQLATLFNIPAGQYREGELANLAFHRWAGDLSGAVTWFNPKTGWDVSAKAGFTFNGTNPATDYTTGSEFHLEGAVEKALSPAFSLGVQAVYFQQVSADTGSGAKLGPFEGTEVGLGGAAAYNFMIGKMPATLRLHGMAEFDATNRLPGTAVWLDFSVPLSLQLPAR